MFWWMNCFTHSYEKFEIVNGLNPDMHELMYNSNQNTTLSGLHMQSKPLKNQQ